MKIRHHRQILKSIQDLSGKPTQHTFSDAYLGNEHPRYPISAPVLRKIAKVWMTENREMGPEDFAQVLTDLIHGKSATEKMMAGILLDYSTSIQRKFDPLLFDDWLEQLTGWAEIDAVCTNNYTTTEIPAQWKTWKGLLIKFSKSGNINKRRASLVFLCSPLRVIEDSRLADIALANIDRLKHEKEILITKAISWLLRSMVKHNRKLLEQYLKQNLDSLPKIAVRETLVKLKTGRKSPKR